MFIKKYDLDVPLSYDDALSAFRDNLDDMSKKGYSLSGDTVIYNSDHRSRPFSGEYKHDHFIVRQTEDSSDIFYRYLPKHNISFKCIDQFNTRVQVHSINMLAMVVFIIMIILTLGMIVLSGGLIMSGESGMPTAFLVMLPAVPAVISAIVAFISSHRINDTMTTLMYIFKNRNND